MCVWFAVDPDGLSRAEMEANLSTEVSMTVLDIVSMYAQHFKKELQQNCGDNDVMQHLFELLLHFLQSSQSELVQKNAFASVRSFIRNVSILYRADCNFRTGKCT